VSTEPRKTGEHMFIIELKSRAHLKSVVVSNFDGGNVLVEGFLGKLEHVNFAEGLMLEIDGANGTLRMDLSRQELERLLPKATRSRKNLAEGVNRE
jgi:hypothetical protein